MSVKFPAFCSRLAVAMFLTAASAQAATPDKSQELKQTQASLAESKARADKLKKNLASMEKTLADLQEETGEIAALLQENEAQRHELETRLTGLREQKAAKESSVADHRAEIGAMLAAAIRMGQVPPHASLAIPGGIVSEVHASRTLAITSNSLKEELDTLGRELAEIEQIQSQIATENDALAAKNEELQTRREELAKRLGDRKRMVATLSTEGKKESARTAELTKKSADLSSLVAALEAERKRELAEQEKARIEDVAAAARAARRGDVAPKVRTIPRRSSTRKEFDLAAARGKLRLPVAGQLVQGYGTAKANNDTSRGIELMSGAGGIVTSPFAGEILFTGPFLGYGRMVIVRHSRTYHTLLAGLARIDVSAGQFLLEGEPIGVMGDAKETRRLYVELRENGRPVDPAPWFGGLGRLASR